MHQEKSPQPGFSLVCHTADIDKHHAHCNTAGHCELANSAWFSSCCLFVVAVFFLNRGRKQCKIHANFNFRGRRPFWTWELLHGYSVAWRATTLRHSPEYCYNWHSSMWRNWSRVVDNDYDFKVHCDKIGSIDYFYFGLLTLHLRPLYSSCTDIKIINQARFYTDSGALTRLDSIVF